MTVWCSLDPDPVWAVVDDSVVVEVGAQDVPAPVGLRPRMKQLLHPEDPVEYARGNVTSQRGHVRAAVPPPVDAPFHMEAKGYSSQLLPVGRVIV